MSAYSGPDDQEGMRKDMAPTLMRRCYRSIPNGVLTAHDLGGLQCEVAS